MIARSDGSWPRLYNSYETAGEVVDASSLDAVFTLLDLVVGLTREAAAHLDACESDDGLALLERRDPLFEEAVGLLASLTDGGGAPSDALPLSISAHDLNRLSATIAELGRIDAAITARLDFLRDAVAQELSDLAAYPYSPPAYTGAAKRPIDLRG